MGAENQVSQSWLAVSVRQDLHVQLLQCHWKVVVGLWEHTACTKMYNMRKEISKHTDSLMKLYLLSITTDKKNTLSFLSTRYRIVFHHVCAPTKIHSSVLGKKIMFLIFQNLKNDILMQFLLQSKIRPISDFKMTTWKNPGCRPVHSGNNTISPDSVCPPSGPNNKFHYCTTGISAWCFLYFGDIFLSDQWRYEKHNFLFHGASVNLRLLRPHPVMVAVLPA